jgi:hypothetical protein
MSDYKFSGHDTFFCKQQWLLKGVELFDKEGVEGFTSLDKAIPKLGVGKNMVLSINYWLKSFGLLEGEKISTIANLIFTGHNAYDKYLEDEGTLWLLQYYVCSQNYASMYHLIFRDYFKERVSSEFSETQIVNFIQRKLIESKHREVSENTLRTDFKVFIRSYVSSFSSSKTIEDDYNSPLLELNLVSVMSRKMNGEDVVYKVNKEIRSSFPVQIFGFCLIQQFGFNTSINYQDIRDTLGNFFGLTNEGLELIVDKLIESYKEFVFNDDAGVRQIQVKTQEENLHIKLLNDYYAV